MTRADVPTKIHEQQMQEFKTAITEAGFDPEDFTAKATEANPELRLPLEGSIVVTRISNNKGMTFSGSSNSLWPIKFDVALRGGLFGDPG